MDPEMPWLERSPNFPAEASCIIIVHITRWKDVWVPCRDPRKSPRPPLHLKNGPNMTLTIRKPRGVHYFKFWRCLTFFFNIVSNPNITVSNRKRYLDSHYFQDFPFILWFFLSMMVQGMVFFTSILFGICWDYWMNQCVLHWIWNIFAPGFKFFFALFSLFFGNSYQTYVRYFDVLDIWGSILFYLHFPFCS